MLQFFLRLIVNSRRHPLSGYNLGALLFFNSLHFLITFFVLDKSQFSRLTSDLPHSLFQLNAFLIFPCSELRNVVNTVNVKSAKSKERDKRIKPDYSALGYQSSFKRLLAGISIMLNSLQFRSRIV